LQQGDWEIHKLIRHSVGYKGGGRNLTIRFIFHRDSLASSSLFPVWERDSLASSSLFPVCVCIYTSFMCHPDRSGLDGRAAQLM
jgi:hypothetical protein